MYYTVLCSSERKEFFFSTNHIQRFRSTLQSALDSFVPVTFSLPISVAPRPSLPSGVVSNLEEYIKIFHDDEKEIANPDPEFQPAYRKEPAA